MPLVGSTTERTVILDPVRQDRTAGVLLGTAAGDALGAGYALTQPSAYTPIGMIGEGGPGREPGEWTDGTSMAIVLARVAAGGLDLRSAEGLTSIARGFADWFARTPRTSMSGPAGCWPPVGGRPPVTGCETRRARCTGPPGVAPATAP